MAQAPEIYSETDLFSFQPVTSKYLSETLEVTKSTIFTDGHLSKCLKIPDDAPAMKELEEFALGLILEGISAIAIDKKTDKVAGIVLNKVFAKNEPFYEIFAERFQTLKARQVIDARHNTLYLVNMFEELKVDTLMELVLLGILPRYRKQGLARKLCEISINIARSLHNGVNVRQAIDGPGLALGPKPQGVAAIFSSFISQKIGKELGFTIIAEKPNHEWRIFGETVVVEKTPTVSTTLECLLL